MEVSLIDAWIEHKTNLHRNILKRDEVSTGYRVYVPPNPPP